MKQAEVANFISCVQREPSSSPLQGWFDVPDKTAVVEYNAEKYGVPYQHTRIIDNAAKTTLPACTKFSTASTTTAAPAPEPGAKAKPNEKTKSNETAGYSEAALESQSSSGGAAAASTTTMSPAVKPSATKPLREKR